MKEEFKKFNDEACMDFVMVNFFMFAIQLLCGVMLYLKMINEFRIGQYLRLKQQGKQYENVISETNKITPYVPSEKEEVFFER
jgi:hypothetical protein